MSNKKDLLREAQNEQVIEIGKNRLSVLKSLDELEGFGGSDDYKISVTTIVEAYGVAGISLTKLREVLPDAAVLKSAIVALRNEKKITEEMKGKTSTLKPVEPKQE